MPDISPETLALRSALDTARGQVATEQGRRMEAETRLRTETGNRFAAQEAAVDTALLQAEESATRIQERWASLQEEGKFTEAAAAMREMSATEARISQLRGQKDWVAQQKQQVSAQPADPLASFNATEREWITKNPRYMEDPSFARKVNAAATHAIEFEGISKDTPEYWAHIERKIYPERQSQQQANAGEGEGAPAGDAGEGGVVDGGPMEQQHTMNIPIAQPTVDAPVMNIDLDKPQEPQQRAVGRGGDGIRSVAAPPSRRIAEAANRVGGNRTRIEPTMQEVEVARALYDAIEPIATDRSDDTIVRWYYALAHDKSHQTTRRRHWAHAEVL